MIEAKVIITTVPAVLPITMDGGVLEWHEGAPEETEAGMVLELQFEGGQPFYHIVGSVNQFLCDWDGSSATFHPDHIVRWARLFRLEGFEQLRLPRGQN